MPTPRYMGGQAVMEGVMMRAPHSYCVAVRKPDGEMITEDMPVPRMSEKHPAFRLPLVFALRVYQLAALRPARWWPLALSRLSSERLAGEKTCGTSFRRGSMESASRSA